MKTISNLKINKMLSTNTPNELQFQISVYYNGSWKNCPYMRPVEYSSDLPPAYMHQGKVCKDLSILAFVVSASVKQHGLTRHYWMKIDLNENPHLEELYDQHTEALLYAE